MNTPEEIFGKLIAQKGNNSAGSRTKVSQLVYLLDKACRDGNMNTVDFLSKAFGGTSKEKESTETENYLSCQKCSKPFKSQNALNGHRKGCK